MSQHHASTMKPNKESGFMIMTIAILLAVFGMMLATYIHLSKLNAEKNNVAITTKSFASVMNKMSLYMAAEGHLPCPAARNLGSVPNNFT